MEVDMERKINLAYSYTHIAFTVQNVLIDTMATPKGSCLFFTVCCDL